MELNKYIGSQIKKYRILKGMNQEDLAVKLDTTKQTISRYENGDRKTNPVVLFEFSKVLDVSVDAFFPERKNANNE